MSEASLREVAEASLQKTVIMLQGLVSTLVQALEEKGYPMQCVECEDPATIILAKLCKCCPNYRFSSVCSSDECNENQCVCSKCASLYKEVMQVDFKK